MAERNDTASRRASLRAAREQQATQAESTESEAGVAGQRPRGGQYGTLAARAAALIAGQADPGGQDAAEDDDEGETPSDAEKTPQSGQDDAQDPSGDEDEGAEEGEPGEGDAPTTVDDAAKRLGMTRQQFNALQVQVGSESMTLGQLKDKLPELAKLDKARDELEDDRGTWELTRLATYRSLQAMIEAIPKNPQTAELLRQFERHHEQDRARELETLHFARPRWADPNYAQAAKGKILGMAKEYGFSRAEIDGIMDHRVLLIAQDYAELRDKVRASRDTARKVSEPSGARPNGQGAPARDDGRPSLNGPGRRAAKPTQEQAAKRVGAILRKR